LLFNSFEGIPARMAHGWVNRKRKAWLKRIARDKVQGTEMKNADSKDEGLNDAHSSASTQSLQDQG